MIFFQHPVWLLLLLPLTAWLFFRPFGSRSANLIQLLIFLLLTLALAGMGIRMPEKKGVLMILCDRSLSMPPGSEAKALEQIRRIARARKSSERFGVLSFAGESVMEKYPSAGDFDNFSAVLSNRDATRLAEALQRAVDLIPRGTPGRILLISDGNWTGSAPDAAFFSAAMEKIAVDFLPLRRKRHGDFAIAGISAPPTAAPGEFCTIACRILAPFPCRLPIRVRKNKGAWQERIVSLKAGENMLFWRTGGDRQGTAGYEFKILPPPEDTVPENNQARCLIRVKGENRILLLSNSPSGNLAKLLAGSGFKVEVRSPAREPITPEMLAGTPALILENIPCSQLSPGVVALAAELVRKGRMGLMMTGGRSSFAVGGWFRTPIGDILPAAMEKQHEIRRRRAAVVIALDRSGSMAASVGGGVTKMSMANLAAAETLKLLAPEDEFGLTAVDSAVHQVILLTPKKNLTHAAGDILAIESMGGGIFVNKALHDGVRQLLNTDAPVRHLLLFADADDAEEPGDYKELLNRSSRAGITVSVVGLGSSSGKDAALLRDIAKRGGGRCYFSDRADELPRLFAEDTFVMVRNAFKTGKTVGRFTAAAQALSGRQTLDGTVEIDGFNLSFAKGKSTVLLAADAGDAPPLALTGYAGLGRTAALNIEADGEYTGKFASDPRAPALLLHLIRHVVMPQSGNTPELMASQNMKGGEFHVELLLDPDRGQELFDRAPELSLLILHPDHRIEERRVGFAWQGPDRLSAQTPVPPGALVSGAVEIPSRPPLPLPPAIRSISPEFAAAEERDITPLVRAAGGRVKRDFSDIWEQIPRSGEKKRCGHFLLAAALFLLLLQAACRRFDWELPSRKFFRRPAAKGKARVLPAPSAPPPVKETAPPENHSAEPEDALSSALKSAKRR